MLTATERLNELALTATNVLTDRSHPLTCGHLDADEPDLLCVSHPQNGLMCLACADAHFLSDPWECSLCGSSPDVAPLTFPIEQEGVMVRAENKTGVIDAPRVITATGLVCRTCCASLGL